MQLDRPIACILQPSYLPWLGVFAMMAVCDIWIFHDDTQYTKQDWRNRNRIKTPSGPAYLTVPVKKHSHNTLIKDIEISNDRNWQESHLRKIRAAYAKQDHVERCVDTIAESMAGEHDNLSELNIRLTIRLAEQMRINPQFVRSSQLKSQGSAESKVIDLCQAVAAKTYINGMAGTSLYRAEEFAKKGIKLLFHAYSHPTYKQDFPPFVSHLSIVDLLCSHSNEDARSLICGGSSFTGV